MSAGTDDPPLTGFVRTLTAMGAHDDAREVYEAWAPRYELDLLEGYGYAAHRIAAQALARCCPDRSMEILDLGCGTGLVAQELVSLGFSTIDGFDASAQMLAQARTKALYRHLIQGDLRDPLALIEASADAAIAVGVFGGGHMGPDCLEAFLRPVRTGGPIVLFANGIPFIEDDYPAHLRRLEEAGMWVVSRCECVNYMDKIHRPGYLVVATRCGS